MACFPRLRSRAAFYGALYGAKGFICWNPGDLKYSHQGDCPQTPPSPWGTSTQGRGINGEYCGWRKKCRGLSTQKKLAPPGTHPPGGGMGVGRAKIEGRAVCGGAGQKYKGPAPPKKTNWPPWGIPTRGGGWEWQWEE